MRIFIVPTSKKYLPSEITGKRRATTKYFARENVEFDVAFRMEREKCERWYAKIFISFCLLSFVDNVWTSKTRNPVAVSPGSPSKRKSEKQIGSKERGRVAKLTILSRNTLDIADRFSALAYFAHVGSSIFMHARTKYSPPFIFPDCISDIRTGFSVRRRKIPYPSDITFDWNRCEGNNQRDVTVANAILHKII